MSRAAVNASSMASCSHSPVSRACTPIPSPRKQGRQLFSGLLEGLNLMVLPLTESPGAPGQGALAIECRADDVNTRALLAALEDPATRGAIAIERALLNEHGGGCHQRFGATLSWLPDLGGLLRIAGRSASDKDIAELRFLPDHTLPAHIGAVRAWDGSLAEKAEATPLLDATALAARLRHDAVFVAHSRALPAGAAPLLDGRKVWTSARRAGSHSPIRAYGYRAAVKDWARNSRPNSSPNRCCACLPRATGMCSRMPLPLIPGRRAAGRAPT